MAGAWLGLDSTFDQLFVDVNKLLLEKSAAPLQQAADLAAYPEIPRYLVFLQSLPPDISLQIISALPTEFALPPSSYSSSMKLPADHPAREYCRQQLDDVAASLQQKYGRTWTVRENYRDETTNFLVEPMSFAIFCDEQVVGLAHVTMAGPERSRLFLESFHTSQTRGSPLLILSFQNDEDLEKPNKARRAHLADFENNIIDFMSKLATKKQFASFERDD